MTNIDQPRGNSTNVDGRAVHNPGAFAPATQSAPEAGSLLAPTVNTSTSVQYTGEEDSMMIAIGTDVWLKDADGNEADLETLLGALPVDPANTCEGCEGSPVIGARAPSNGPSEVERCDSCETFAGDFEAAQAVGARLGEGFTVWFEPDGDRQSAEHLEADRDHPVRPVPEDDGFSNCECGLACTSDGSRHGFDA